MNKITQIIVEPETIYTGSTFLLKIKAIKYLTYQEIKDNLTYDTLTEHTYGQLKGE